MNKISNFLAGITFGALGLIAIDNTKNYTKAQNTPVDSPTVLTYETQAPPQTNVSVRETQNVKVKEGPVYSSEVVPANMCSRYVRHAAEDLFGIGYPSDDAWNIRKHSGIEEIPVKDKISLERMAADKTLEPGMILGAYNPTSRYNETAKKNGAGYTHVMIYLGKDGQDLFFADKFGKKTRTRISLEGILKSGLKPVEVMYRAK